MSAEHSTDRVDLLHKLLNHAYRFLGEQGDCPHCDLLFPQTPEEDPARDIAVIRQCLQEVATTAIEGVDDDQAEVLVQMLLEAENGGSPRQAMADIVQKVRTVVAGWLLLDKVVELEPILQLPRFERIGDLCEELATLLEEEKTEPPSEERKKRIQRLSEEVDRLYDEAKDEYKNRK
jgi:hypothetical protein